MIDIENELWSKVDANYEEIPEKEENVSRNFNNMRINKLQENKEKTECRDGDQPYAK